MYEPVKLILTNTSRMTGSLAERWAAVKEFFARASSAVLEYRSPNRWPQLDCANTKTWPQDQSSEEDTTSRPVVWEAFVEEKPESGIRKRNRSGRVLGRHGDLGHSAMPHCCLPRTPWHRGWHWWLLKHRPPVS